jgi:hypothetical protein
MEEPKSRSIVSGEVGVWEAHTKVEYSCASPEKEEERDEYCSNIQI